MRPLLTAVGNPTTLTPTTCIAQATFEGDLLSHAQRKKHSTVLEALEVGQKMRAYRVLLTHFSQRYSKATQQLTPIDMILLPFPIGFTKVPEVEESHPISKRVCVAFDLMRITLRSLPWLPSLLSPMKSLFIDEAINIQTSMYILVSNSSGSQMKAVDKGDLAEEADGLAWLQDDIMADLDVGDLPPDAAPVFVSPSEPPANDRRIHVRF